MGKTKRKQRVKAVRAKAQAKMARDEEALATARNQVTKSTEDLTPNKSKIASSKPTDDAPIPTENNGNSHPIQANQSHKPGQNVASLEQNVQDTHHTGLNSSESQTTSENNGNSKPAKTFVEVATNSTKLQTREKIKTTTFHILRDILENSSKKDTDEDDVTVNAYNKTKNYVSLRLSVMFAIPAKIDDAPIEAIRIMNAMIKSLGNKVPSIRLAPWTMKLGEKGRLMSELPEDVDIVEKYAYDYSRFVSAGKHVYCRLHIVYDKNKTSKGEISEVIMGFKKPREQAMNIAHSDALRPKQMGFFTGSVKGMAESPDFHKSFMKFFKLSSLGLWWAWPKSELTWNKDSSTWALHYELDNSDVEKGKNEVIKAYFAKNSSLVDDNFFGTSMSVAPNFKPMMDDDVKMRITKHAKKQLIIGKSIQSVTIGGSQILNWADEKMENTMHRQLMLVESIYDKNVINTKTKGGDRSKSGKNSFKGRLFYAIITNQRTKMITFYFSKANSEEARSVARALPFFIRDHFKLEPEYYCGSEAIEECHDGVWDFKKRSFLTMEEKDERDKFTHLVDTVTAEREIFISDTHKQAMAMEGDDLNSVDTRLTKNQAPGKINGNEEMSEITGETRESKAKAYAAKETKKVSLQYIDTIEQMNGNHQNEMVDMQDKLAALMKELEKAKEGNKSDKVIHRNSKDEHEMEVDSGLSESSHDNTDEEEQGDDEDLSGISSSSASNNEDEEDSVAIVGVKRGKNNSTSENGTTDSPFRKKRDSKNTFDFNKGNESSDRTSKVAKVTPKKKSPRISPRFSAPPLANGSERSAL